MDTRRPILVNLEKYRRYGLAQKPEPFTLTNWLADHPRWVCAILCAAILIAGQLDQWVLP